MQNLQQYINNPTFHQKNIYKHIPHIGIKSLTFFPKTTKTSTIPQDATNQHQEKFSPQKPPTVQFFYY